VLKEKPVLLGRGPQVRDNGGVGPCALVLLPTCCVRTGTPMQECLRTVTWRISPLTIGDLITTHTLSASPRAPPTTPLLTTPHAPSFEGGQSHLAGPRLSSDSPMETADASLLLTLSGGSGKVHYYPRMEFRPCFVFCAQTRTRRLSSFSVASGRGWREGVRMEMKERRTASADVH
jgi:hypothetical protein